MKLKKAPRLKKSRLKMLKLRILKKPLLVASLGLFICFSLCSCSKKSGPPQVIQDSGPAFSIDSNIVKFEVNTPAEVNLKRDDASFGPEIVIQPSSTQGLTSSEKKIMCGQLKPFEGKKVSAPDMHMFTFHISEEEFPGLNILPLRSKCTMQIILTNALGSTVTRTLPITIKFDKHPTLTISNQYATVGLQRVQDDFDYKMEEYTIQNPLPYAVGFSFQPTHWGETRTFDHYKANKNIAFDPGPQNGSENILYSARKFISIGEKIYISDNAVNVAGSMSKKIRFMVKPGETVTVGAMAHLPQGIPRSISSNDTKCPPTFFFNGCSKNVLGVYILKVSDAATNRSLSAWREFEFSEDDEKEPFPSIATQHVAISPLSTDPWFSQRILIKDPF